MQPPARSQTCIGKTLPVIELLLQGMPNSQVILTLAISFVRGTCRGRRSVGVSLQDNDLFNRD